MQLASKFRLFVEEPVVDLLRCPRQALGHLPAKLSQLLFKEYNGHYERDSRGE